MKLNHEQQRVVTHPARRKQVIAGAGSGKTHTMVELIASQLEDGLKPGELLLITFTRKAAGEMTARLQKRLNRPDSFLKPAFIGTFHAMALRMIRPWLGSFSVIGEEEQRRTVNALLKRQAHRLAGVSVEAMAALLLKCPDRSNESMLTASLPSGLDESLRTLLLEVNRSYTNDKQKNNQLDLDDIYRIWFELFEQQADFRQRWQQRFQYAVVDEFQDSGPREVSLLQCIDPPRLVAVGDPRQSIYSFRQADPVFLVRFDRYFKHSRRFYLRNNYRSSPQVVSLCEKIIGPEKALATRPLKSKCRRGPRPAVYLVESPQHYSRVLSWLFEQWFSGSNDPDFTTAILCRTNRQVENLVKWLGDLLKLVTVQTVHQSKGLEYDRVIVYGLDCRNLPHPTGVMSEELRLLYVAMSRAKSRLAVIGCTGAEQSPFLERFPTGCLHFLD